MFRGYFSDNFPINYFGAIITTRRDVSQSQTILMEVAFLLEIVSNLCCLIH